MLQLGQSFVISSLALTSRPWLSFSSLDLVWDRVLADNERLEIFLLQGKTSGHKSC